MPDGIEVTPRALRHDPVPVVAEILRGYALDASGIHGVRHWARVGETGLRLAAVTGADPEVVALFALFHDACRRNEGRDPGHGRRGAELARAWRGRWVHLDDAQFNLLHDACCRHTDGLTDGDVTVQTCWDADRLDLGRVGIAPCPHRLCTHAARELLAWADARATTNHEPPCVRDWLALRPVRGQTEP